MQLAPLESVPIQPLGVDLGGVPWFLSVSPYPACDTWGMLVDNLSDHRVILIKVIV